MEVLIIGGITTAIGIRFIQTVLRHDDATAVHQLHDDAPARLVYVSCDPVTLARDLVQLRSGGLELQSIQALDLVPGTFHVECVATLARRSSLP